MESPLPLAAGIPVHCAHHAIYADAIRQHGWREAITVSRRSGFMISGHGAVEAARRIPADQVPVEYQDYASEQEELADLLAHNRLAELAQTDGDKLLAMLQQLGGAVEEIAPAPQFPITPRLNEAHRLLCVAVDNETDWQFLKNIAGIRTERSYKNTTIGDGHVVLFAGFLASLRENLHSLSIWLFRKVEKVVRWRKNLEGGSGEGVD